MSASFTENLFLLLFALGLACGSFACAAFVCDRLETKFPARRRASSEERSK